MVNVWFLWQFSMMRWMVSMFGFFDSLVVFLDLFYTFIVCVLQDVFD